MVALTTDFFTKTGLRKGDELTIGAVVAKPSIVELLRHNGRSPLIPQRLAPIQL